MEKTKEINEEEPVSIMEDFYRYTSCEYHRNIDNDNSESIDYTRYNNTFPKKINKKVKFNQNVTIINIPSHKKMVKKQSYQNFNPIIDEDEDKDKKCVNCNIF